MFEDGVSIAEPASNALGVLVTCRVCVRHTNHYAQFPFGVVCCDCCREAYIKYPKTIAARIMIAALPAEVAKKKKLKVKRKELREKAMALTLEGKGPKEVGELIGCYPGTVARFRREWLSDEANRANHPELVKDSESPTAKQKESVVLNAMLDQNSPMMQADVVNRVNQAWCNPKTVGKLLRRIGADRGTDGRYTVKDTT